MTYKTKGKSLYRTAYRLTCTTCPATLLVDKPGKLAEGWEQDKCGDIHCGKCMRTLRAMVAEDRRRMANKGDE